MTWRYVLHRRWRAPLRSYQHVWVLNHRTHLRYLKSLRTGRRVWEL